MKTSSQHQSSNYDYTGRSVIIQQQQHQQHFTGPPSSEVLDGYLGAPDVETAASLLVVPSSSSHRRRQRYVVDANSEDVAIVSSATSVGRSRETAAGVSGEVVIVDDEVQLLQRYPTIQLAGPSVGQQPDVAPVVILGTRGSAQTTAATVNGSGSAGASKYPQPEVVITKGTSKRKRETGKLAVASFWGRQGSDDSSASPGDLCRTELKGGTKGMSRVDGIL